MYAGCRLGLRVTVSNTTICKFNFLGRSEMNDLYFEFLDDLRASATMNMMGAPRELQNEFGLNKVQARSIFQLWCLNLEGE